MSLLDTPLTRQLGIEVPLICGAMYPCSNAELVAAVSAAGGIGVVQPLSMIYVYGQDLRDGLRLIRRITDKPIGMNVLIERSSKFYLERMRRYVDIAMEEGVRFFVTSLGNPRWVVDRVAPAGGIVYHDVTERKWAEKGLAGGVHGLIAVNDRAGGHAGPRSAEALYAELADLGVPVVCAGGIGDETGFVAALRMGYAGAQLGTRFIATNECGAHDDYKQAIVRASEADIVLTERVTGVPLSVIRTPYVERIGTKAGPIARWMLRGRRTKHWMRTIYALRSAWQLKRASLAGGAGEKTSKDYWQAGKSVAGIHAVEPAGEIVRRFAAAHFMRAAHGGLYVMMGVAGSGKSTIGAQVARVLGVEFLEGDDLHSPDNVQRMAAGIPLTDADRRGWLLAIAARLRDARRAQIGLVVSCSALKRSYRDLLRSKGDKDVRFVYLAGSPTLLAGRMANRRGHFMPPSLLDSQLAILEEPAPDEGAWVCDIRDTPDTIVGDLVNHAT